jgi:hypothetical protein
MEGECAVGVVDAGIAHVDTYALGRVSGGLITLTGSKMEVYCIRNDYFGRNRLHYILGSITEGDLSIPAGQIFAKGHQLE